MANHDAAGSKSQKPDEVARLRVLRRIGRSLQLAAGAVVVAMGIAILTGELTTFSYWLLETFPVFARIG